MGLNLINDAWIPVYTAEGARRIRAWEVADAGVEWVDWGRVDLDLGCLELLIGLVLIADPPENETDWHARYQRPLGARLRKRLKALSPHFELDGAGPRFMQDLEPFETEHRMTTSSADMLFIDSPGARARRNNADIPVSRDRYGDLPLDLAAMALYTLQAWAPSGGAGNRTALRRGGGPTVTLVQPVAAGTHRLWRLVWANVPFGAPLALARGAQTLPWLSATRTSEAGTTVTPTPATRHRPCSACRDACASCSRASAWWASSRSGTVRGTRIGYTRSRRTTAPRMPQRCARCRCAPGR